MKSDFPIGVREIIKGVHEEEKMGTLPRVSAGTDNAVDTVVDRIRSKAIRMERGMPVSTPVEAMKDLEWAAKQYFRILLNDLRHGHEDFRDHEAC